MIEYECNTTFFQKYSRQITAMKVIKELSKINSAINHKEIIGAILPKFILASPKRGELVMNKDSLKCILEYIKYMIWAVNIPQADIESEANIMLYRLNQGDYDHYIDALSKRNPNASELPYSTIAVIVANMKMAYNISLFLKSGDNENESDVLRIIVFRTIYAMEVILKYYK